jgi:hypothetical protein
MKKLLSFILGGAILGAIVASLVAPGLINWWNTPGISVPPGYDLSGTTREIISSFISAQLIGAGLGAVLVTVLGVLILKAFTKRAPAPAVPPSKVG